MIFNKREITTLSAAVILVIGLSFGMISSLTQRKKVNELGGNLRYQLSLYNKLLNNLSAAQSDVQGYALTQNIIFLDNYFPLIKESSEIIHLLKNFPQEQGTLSAEASQKIENLNTIIRKINQQNQQELLIKKQIEKENEQWSIFKNKLQQEIISKEKQLFALSEQNKSRLGIEIWTGVAVLLLIIASSILTIKTHLDQEKDKLALASIASECKLNYDTTKQRTYEMVAHELRVPLQIIVGYLGLLRLNNISVSRQISAHEKIDKAIARINNIVDTMLFLSSDLQPEFKLEDIAVVCKTAIEQMKGLTDNPFIIENNLDYPVFLNINEPIFTSFLYNLLSNAIKYSPANKPVTVEIERTATKVIIQISDKGIGIPDSELKQLFNPFFRASNAKKIKGTGLGLVVAKKSVEIHGGELSASSVENVGTTFTASFLFVRSD